MLTPVTGTLPKVKCTHQFGVFYGAISPDVMMADMMKNYRWWLLLLISTLPVVWPYTTTAFFKSDDGILHLFRLSGLDDALRQGILYPRFLPAFAFGYGHPVFNYYGPLSYYIAELVHLFGADLPRALTLTFALGYVAAGVTAYLLARRFASPAPALLGAVAYVYSPYHLASGFQRGAWAEHWAWVLLPLILWSITLPQADSPATAAWSNGTVSTRRNAIFVSAMAALILTHSLTAMLFTPFAALYFWFSTRSLPLKQRVMRLTFSLLAVLGLSAFYWLPIAIQGSWVGLDTLTAFDPALLNFAPTLRFIQWSPFFYYEPRSGDAPHALALLDFIFLLASLIACFDAWQKRYAWTQLWGLFLSLSIVALWMTVDSSLPVWRALRIPLIYLQFPWRFMLLSGLGISMASVFVLRAHPRVALLAAALIMVTTTPGIVFKPLPSPRSDLLAIWHSEFDIRNIGTTWNAEFMPRWVHAVPADIPLASQAPVSEVSPSVPQLTLLETNYTRRVYRVQSDEPATLRLHQFYLPEWQATLDGRALSPFPSTNFGLLSIELPRHAAGVLEINFGSTLAEQWGIYLSLFTAAILLYRVFSHWFWGLTLTSVTAAVLLLMAHQPTSPRVDAVQAQVGGFANLIAVQTQAGTYRPGDTIKLTLTWQTRQETYENFVAFVHLEDQASGQRIAQSDGDPVGTYSPTSQWRVGELVEDTRSLRIPPDAPSGTLQLYAGLYRRQPLQNLPVIQNGQAIPLERISLGTIQVAAP